MHGFLKCYQSQFHCQILNQWQRRKFLFSSQDFQDDTICFHSPRQNTSSNWKQKCPRVGWFSLGASLLQDAGHRTQFHVGSLLRKHCLEAIQVSHGFVFSLWPTISMNVFLLASCSKTHKASVDLAFDGIAYLGWTFLSVLFPSCTAQMPLYSPSIATSRN